MEYYRIYRNVISNILENYNINQKQLAKILGVSKQTVSSWYCSTALYTVNRSAWDKLHLLDDAKYSSKLNKAIIKFICKVF